MTFSPRKKLIIASGFTKISFMFFPAASHSGWEDHMQSDQYHYLHHRSRFWFFED